MTFVNALSVTLQQHLTLLSKYLALIKVLIIIFEVKLTFELLTVHRQQHSFSTHKRMFLWKCRSFRDRKCLDLRGTRTPNLRIHANCSNRFSYRGQTFAVACFEHWLCGDLRRYSAHYDVTVMLPHLDAALVIQATRCSYRSTEFNVCGNQCGCYNNNWRNRSN